MSESTTRSIITAGNALKLAAFLLMGVMLYFGNFQFSNSTTNIFVPGVVGLTLFMDGVIVDRIQNLAPGQKWERRFLPSMVVLHSGAALIAIRLLYDSWPLDVAGYVVVFIGFAWCINQVD